MDFFSSSLYCIQHCLICRPSDSTVSEDAGIEPRTVSLMDVLCTGVACPGGIQEQVRVHHWVPSGHAQADRRLQARSAIPNVTQVFGSGSVSGSGLISGSRRAKMTHKSRKELGNFIF